MRLTMGRMPDLQGAFVIICGVCAVGGCAVIEGLIWIFYHINIGWAS